jgi:AbrB family looped-hinge helix DNA binding protein
MLTTLRIKGQVTIPKEILKKLELSTGDYIDVTEENGKIIICPVEIVPKAKDGERKGAKQP